MSRRAGVFRIAVMSAGVFVAFLLAEVVPAGAQRWPGAAWWTPKEPEVNESGLHVDLWLSTGRPGRLMYRTVDGSARALEDYTPVSGEVIFDSPTGEDQRIRVPILDDDADEGYEDFIVEAWEDSDAALDRQAVRVSISDNDWREEDDESFATASATTTTSKPASPPIMSPGRRDASPPTTTAPPPAEVGTELASAELVPGPGFGLPIDRVRRRSESDARGASSAPAAFASGLGAVVLSFGGVWLRHRRRWSATRS